MRLGTGPRLLSQPALRTHDTRVPCERRHLSVSLMCLRDILAQAERLHIHFYRMAAQMVPVLAQRDLSAFWRQLDECRELAVWLGLRVVAAGIRLSVHPVLDVQLGSAEEGVVARGLAVVTAWAALLDCLGLGPEARVVVHSGGSGADGRFAAEQFARNFEKLPESAGRRLALENDERLCSLNDALWLWRQTGIPVVWDYLHWRCLNPAGDGARDAYLASAATWPAGVPPKLHFSSPRTAGSRNEQPLPREHADFIDPFAFLDFLAALGPEPGCDIMLEARAKEVALLKLRSDLAALGCGQLLPEEISASLCQPAL